MTRTLKYARTTIALAVLAMLVTAAAGCRKPIVPPPEMPALVDERIVTVSEQAIQDGIIVVRTPTVAMRRPVLQAPAVLALDESRTARVGSLTEGIVVSTSTDVGVRVGAGTVLARVHSHIVHDARAGLRTADAERRRREAEAGLARQNEARAERLLAAKAIAPQELSRARVERIAADEAVDIAGAELQRTQEDLRLLGLASSDDDMSRNEYVSIR